MSFSLRYCPNGEQVLARLTQLYENQAQDIILAKMNVPGKVLAEFAKNHEDGLCEYPNIDERLEFWDAYTSEHTPIRDDCIPAAYMSEMDQGLYGGILGGDVRFQLDAKRGWISSMVPPILKDWSEFDKLSFSTNHQWYRRYINQLEAFVAGSKGKYGITNFILINGLNFVFELVGATNAYMNLEERPDMIRKAFELAHKINLQIHKTFFEKVPLLQGGTCDYFGQWLPGRIIMESVDPFHMTSVDYFEKWGRGPVEKIFAEFDGGTIHIHGNGRHLLEAVSTIKGLKMIWLGDDPGYPPAFEVLNELKKRIGNMPVVCLVKFADFHKALKEHKLLGGVFYDVSDVPDIKTANRTMDLVRKYHN